MTYMMTSYQGLCVIFRLTWPLSPFTGASRCLDNRLHGPNRDQSELSLFRLRSRGLMTSEARIMLSAHQARAKFNLTPGGAVANSNCLSNPLTCSPLPHPLPFVTWPRSTAITQAQLLRDSDWLRSILHWTGQILCWDAKQSSTMLCCCCLPAGWVINQSQFATRLPQHCHPYINNEIMTQVVQFVK